MVLNGDFFPISFILLHNPVLCYFIFQFTRFTVLSFYFCFWLIPFLYLHVNILSCIS